ncbi:DNA-J related domain-containing protein [Colwellia asteriadis]|uniref:DNA-J related domain-containing protein n=1 Tax=Colwellia asteriadis TaxID=517723 RepID=A0ABN1L591_9GAMM
MVNPLIMPILEYLRKQKKTCSLIDLINLCQQDLLALINKNVDEQIAIFQKNFFIMNALYQIQQEINNEGFLLKIFPLEIYIVPNVIKNGDTNTAVIQKSLSEDEASRDKKLAHYYLDWQNLTSVTLEEIDTLFSGFWQRYNAADKVSSALATLGLSKNSPWTDIRQAYQKKVKLTHPDKGGCAQDFIEIRQAYEVLSISYRNA